MGGLGRGGGREGKMTWQGLASDERRAGERQAGARENDDVHSGGAALKQEEKSSARRGQVRVLGRRQGRVWHVLELLLVLPLSMFPLYSAYTA